MAEVFGSMDVDSTPHASPAHGSDADQAGACFSPLKDPRSNEQLARHLVDKGLSVSNEKDLLEALETKGYYRLKGYWLTLERNGRFKKGTTLDDILEIEAFNREISAFVFTQIAPIEICLRSQMTTVLAQHYGARALHCPEAFKVQDDYAKLQKTLERETAQALRLRKPLALHNMDKYGQLPVWAETENTSLGTLSKIFDNLADKRVLSEIASSFNTTWPFLKSWLRYLTQIRNACAHHDRLYNRIFCILPKMFREHSHIDNARLFPTFIVLFRLHESLDPANANLLRQQLGRIVDAHPTVDLRPVGFPANWREVLRVPDPDLRDIVRPRGRQGGHPLKNAAAIEQALYLYDMRAAPVADIAKQCGMSLSTLYKYINQRKEADRERNRERVEYAAVKLEG